LLLDDHVLFRQSLTRVLKENRPDLEFLEAGSGPEAFAQIGIGDPDLLLLDLNLGAASGLAVLADLKKAVPEIRTLIVSMHRDGHHVAAALKAKVQGFVAKDASVENLVEAVGAVLEGRTWFEPKLLEAASQFLSLPEASKGGRLGDEFGGYRSLTSREQEVFLHLAEGKTVAEVSRHLGRSAKTVENHRSAVYQKLGLGDRYELFAFAKKLGLIL
jgi:DNA-binding NarL/FixJ family response regulator